MERHVRKTVINNTIKRFFKFNWVTESPPKFDTLLASWYPTCLQSFIISHSSCAEQYGDMSYLLTYLGLLRPCSHLFRFAFRSRSSPVPLVRVAFTPGKIDWNGSGPVARSHLFRNATGTSSPVNTPHPTPSTPGF